MLPRQVLKRRVDELDRDLRRYADWAGRVEIRLAGHVAALERLAAAFDANAAAVAAVASNNGTDAAQPALAGEEAAAASAPATDADLPDRAGSAEAKDQAGADGPGVAPDRSAPVDSAAGGAVDTRGGSGGQGSTAEETGGGSSSSGGGGGTEEDQTAATQIKLAGGGAAGEERAVEGGWAGYAGRDVLALGAGLDRQLELAATLVLGR
jgi:hypothetical protein